ncbi:hypothetical protein [Lacticaseibacillus sp. GG6-2]
MDHLSYQELQAKLSDEYGVQFPWQVKRNAALTAGERYELARLWDAMANHVDDAPQKPRELQWFEAF